MLWRLALALLAGVMLAFSFPLSLPALNLPWPLGAWHFWIGDIDLSDSYIQLPWLSLLALIPLFFAIRGSARPLHAFWLGYCSGLAWLLPGLIWIGSFGTAPVVLLVLYFALPVGGFGYLAWWLLNSRHAALSPQRMLWGLPLAWTAIEYLRSFGFWAFPWNLLGYSLARQPLLIQTADLGSVYLISFLIVLCNSTAAVLLMRPPAAVLERVHPLMAWRWPRRWATAGLGVAVLAAALLYGAWRLDELHPPDLVTRAFAAQPEAAKQETANKPENGSLSKDGTAVKARGGTSSLDQKHKATTGARPKTKPKVAVEQPLDLILVQGGLNTLESWTTAGLLQKSLQAYLPPSQTAVAQWKAEHPGQGGSPGFDLGFESESYALPGSRFDLAGGPNGTPALQTGAQAGLPAERYLPAGTVARDDPLTPPGSTPAASPASSFQQQLGTETRPAAGQKTPAAKVAQKTPQDKPGEKPDLLIVWPESVLPMRLDPARATSLPGTIRSLLRKVRSSAILLGALGEPNRMGDYENGCLLYTREGQAIWPHSKVRLVPFGEVVPFRRAISFLDYPWGGSDITEGQRLVPLNWKGHSLGLMICFDNVFGYVTRREALAGAEGFVLMTNNSWYRLASGIRQHCDLDYLRAVENRRPLARVSTTGESHLIDSAGRTLQESAPRCAAVLQGRMTPGHEKTVYQHVGDLFAQLSVIGAMLLLLPPIVLRRGESML